MYCLASQSVPICKHGTKKEPLRVGPPRLALLADLGLNLNGPCKQHLECRIRVMFRLTNCATSTGGGNCDVCGQQPIAIGMK